MAIWARSSSTSEKPDSTSLAEAALLCVLADLATSQPRTEATGRSAGGMLPPVPPVPMVLQVCFRSPDWGTGFSNSLAAALPCSKSAPVCGHALENTTKHLKRFIIYILWICWCVAACISHSRVNGKFPDGLTSVLPHLFSIPLSPPPPPPRSSLQLFDTRLCVKQRRNWKYYMPQIVWRAFPRSSWRNVYNSFSFRLYLFLEPPLIQGSFWCYVSAKVLVMLQMSGLDRWERA